MTGARTFWALAGSLALHAAAFRYGGDLLVREAKPLAPPVRTEVHLLAAQPEPRPLPPAIQPQRPPRPVAKAPRPNPAALMAPAAPPSRGTPTPRPATAPPARVDIPQTAPARRSDLSPAPAAPPDSAGQPGGAAAAPQPNPPLEPDELLYPPSRADYAALVASVRGSIDRAKRYPRLARRAGYEGRVLLKFRILASGQVAEIRVLESSAHELLDRAAVSAVERAAPFRQEATQIRGAAIEVMLPVIFRLR